MAGRIFIGYRRDDSSGTAGRLHDRLVPAFGRKKLFMDVDDIPAGVDFSSYLNDQLATCDVFLAVIGPNWLDAKDDSGHRRLDNPNDFVAVEIAAALGRNIRVIPITVDGAQVPKATQLPDLLKPLALRNAIEIRNAYFGRDAETLIKKVREALKDKRRGRARWLVSATAVAALMLVVWIGLNAFGDKVRVMTNFSSQKDKPQGRVIADDRYTNLDNFDIRGGDFDAPVKKVDRDKCAGLCLGDKRCVAYTFDKLNQYCFLKSSVIKLTSNPLLFSGIRIPISDSPFAMHVYRGQALQGQDYSSAKTASWNDCHNSCNLDKNCLGFSFVKNDQICHVFSRIDKLLANADADSGMKVQEQ
jgi:hypothetical protein